MQAVSSQNEEAPQYRIDTGGGDYHNEGDAERYSPKHTYQL